MKDELKENMQTIIIVICLSIVIGTVLWIIYDKIFANDLNNSEVEKFEGDMSGIQTTERPKDNTLEEFFETQNPKNKYQFNNNNPIKTIKNGGRVTVNHDKAGTSTSYAIPSDTDSLKGRNISSTMIEMNYLSDQTSYEEFIQTCTKTIQNINYAAGAKYSTRQIQNGNQKFYIIMEEGEYWLNSYFCLAKEGYTYLLTVMVYKPAYNENIEKTLNKIFCSYVIN